MQQSLTSHSLQIAGTSVSALSVAIIYEDFEAGKHAKRTYDYLVDALGAETQFTNTMWKFDVLVIPKLREIAAKDAAMADIVIIACHGGRQLPAQIQMWADQWLAFHGNTMALVSLCDCSREQAQGVRNYLEFLATRGEMEFFAQPEEVSAARHMPAQPAQERTFEMLSGAMRHEVSIPRWGINE